MLALAGLVSLAGTRCEPWCKNTPCSDLSGGADTILSECGSCDDSFLCHPRSPNSANGNWAKCRVATSYMDGSEEDIRRSGYGYKDEHDDIDEPYIVDSERAFPQREQHHGHGTEPHSYCEVSAYHHSEINRTMLLAATRPLLILGATDDWPAHERWSLHRLLEDHHESVFSAGLSGARTVGEVIREQGLYHTGQMNLPHECYSDGVDSDGEPMKGHEGWSLPRFFERRYSPFVHQVASDYVLHEYLQPIRLLQMSISNGGRGTGVAPEDHPSAWFAAIKGRKRWAFHPPNRNEVPDYLGLFRDRVNDSCAIVEPFTSTVVCDQPVGSIMWVPAGWYHETCSLDDFMVGMGALSYDGANEPPSHPPRNCSIPADMDTHEVTNGNMEKETEYNIGDISFCATSLCPQLPYAKRL